MPIQQKGKKYRATCHVEDMQNGKKVVHDWKGPERNSYEAAYTDYTNHYSSEHKAKPFKPGIRKNQEPGL